MLSIVLTKSNCDVHRLKNCTTTCPIIAVTFYYIKFI